MDQTVIRTEAADDIKETVRQTVDGLGGFGRFIGEGERVLVKPNFNTCDPFPASSEFGFVAAVVDLCHESGAGEVILGESSTHFLETRRVMEGWGIDRLTSIRPWLQVVNFDEGRWVRREVPQGRYLKHLSVPEVLDRVDRLLLLPCLKTHKYAAYTGALKLSVGLMKPRQRLALHVRRIQEKIAEMNTVIRSDLVIMDARRCFINEGPSSGEVREPGLVLASRSRTAIDLEGVAIIQGFEGNSLSGREPRELLQLARALELGLDG